MAYTLADNVLTPPTQQVKVLDVKEARAPTRAWRHLLPCGRGCACLGGRGAAYGRLRRSIPGGEAVSGAACTAASVPIRAWLLLEATRCHELPPGSPAARSADACAQTVRDGRDYIEFEFAAKAGGYIRHALAVVTVGNGARSA